MGASNEMNNNNIKDVGELEEGELLELPPKQPVLIKKTQSYESEYESLEELGKGKFGVVNRCIRKNDKLELAAKFIRKTSSSKSEVLREIEMMNLLHHKRLINLFDAYETPKQMIVIMELVTGGELFEKIVEDDNLTEKQVIRYMKQVLYGVKHMHRKNMVHLDLKPENILCLGNGEPGYEEIKLIDFGMTRVLSKDKDETAMCGTPEFVAPEVITFNPITLASDMWSLGVITYVLLSGLSPFMGDDDNETLKNVTLGEYDFEDEDEIFENLSDEAKQFIEELLLLKPKERMTVEESLEHPWLKGNGSEKKLATKNLKKFIARRRWQRTMNTIKAVSRLAGGLSIFGAKSGAHGSEQKGSFIEKVKKQEAKEKEDERLKKEKEDAKLKVKEEEARKEKEAAAEEEEHKQQAKKQKQEEEKESKRQEELKKQEDKKKQEAEIKKKKIEEDKEIKRQEEVKRKEELETKRKEEREQKKREEEEAKVKREENAKRKKEEDAKTREIEKKKREEEKHIKEQQQKNAEAEKQKLAEDQRILEEAKKEEQKRILKEKAAKKTAAAKEKQMKEAEEKVLAEKKKKDEREAKLLAEKEAKLLAEKQEADRAKLLAEQHMKEAEKVAHSNDAKKSHVAKVLESANSGYDSPSSEAEEMQRHMEVERKRKREEERERRRQQRKIKLEAGKVSNFIIKKSGDSNESLTLTFAGNTKLKQEADAEIEKANAAIIRQESTSSSSPDLNHNFINKKHLINANGYSSSEGEYGSSSPGSLKRTASKPHKGGVANRVAAFQGGDVYWKNKK